MNMPTEEKTPDAGRWTMLRDLGVLQVKLIVDGLRDIILVPASLVAAIVSLASTKNGRPGLQFYHLLLLQQVQILDALPAEQSAATEILITTTDDKFAMFSESHCRKKQWFSIVQL